MIEWNIPEISTKAYRSLLRLGVAHNVHHWAAAFAALQEEQWIRSFKNKNLIAPKDCAMKPVIIADFYKCVSRSFPSLKLLSESVKYNHRCSRYNDASSFWPASFWSGSSLFLSAIYKTQPVYLTSTPVTPRIDFHKNLPNLPNRGLHIESLSDFGGLSYWTAINHWTVWPIYFWCCSKRLNQMPCHSSLLKYPFRYSFCII